MGLFFKSKKAKAVAEPKDAKGSKAGDSGSASAPPSVQKKTPASRTFSSKTPDKEVFNKNAATELPQQVNRSPLYQSNYTSENGSNGVTNTALTAAFEAAALQPEDSGSARSDSNLPEGWQAVESGDGRTYYWNLETDEVSWDQPSLPATPSREAHPSGPASIAAGSVVSDPGSDGSGVASSGQRGKVMLAKASVFEGQAASDAARIKGSSQHAQAMLSLQRKQEKIANGGHKTSNSQHAQALKGLETSQLRSMGGATQHELALRSLNKKLDSETTQGWEVSSTQQTEKTVRVAKESLFGSVGGPRRNTQREDAMRKLNAHGVVSIKEAFGTRSHQGSQHSRAMNAFKQMDTVDVSTGSVKKSALKKGHGPAPPPPAGGASKTSQRAQAVSALKGQLNEESAGTEKSCGKGGDSLKNSPVISPRSEKV